MYDMRWRKGGDESARLVGGCVAENDAAARGVELADQGLARLRGAVGEDYDFAVKSLVRKPGWGEAAWVARGRYVRGGGR